MAKRNKPANAGDTLAGLTWAPALTPAQIGEIEGLVNGSGDLAVARRVNLAVLARTPAELQAAWAGPEGLDAMTDVQGMVMQWRDYLTKASELADLALDRLAATGNLAAKAARVMQ